MIVLYSVDVHICCRLVLVVTGFRLNEITSADFIEEELNYWMYIMYIEAYKSRNDSKSLSDCDTPLGLLAA